MAGEAIFVGYRREDTADVAGRIYDAMAQRFGKQRVFKDVDNIGPGIDFGDYIKTVLPRCRVALVLIGPNWLATADENGNRRLDNPQDWVRVEIETALATPGLLVVPILVNGAHMPRAEEVPESVRPLLRRNAAIIRRDPDFHDDVERLATAIRASVNTGILDLSKIGGLSDTGGGARKSRAPLLIGIAIAATIAVGAAIYFGPYRNSFEFAQTPTRTIDTQRPASAPTSAPARSIPIIPETVPIQGQTFEVGRYEVTFAQWDACVEAGGCTSQDSDKGLGRGNQPVISVSWDDAQAYVAWLSEHTGHRYRLLTSAEWDIAARAGSPGRFSWGDDDPVCSERARNGANFHLCADDGPRPVGSFEPNAFGLYDMHGNVPEWVVDCYQVDCSTHVLRGGAWYTEARDLQFGANSNWGATAGRVGDHGFRVAKD